MTPAEKRQAVKRLLDRLEAFEKEGHPSAHSEQIDKLYEIAREIDDALDAEQDS